MFLEPKTSTADLIRFVEENMNGSGKNGAGVLDFNARPRNTKLATSISKLHTMGGYLVWHSMKLFHTPNSPYARTARIALREYGLLAKAEEIVAANRKPDNPVLKFSPVGRVPTLIIEGLVITEAHNVFEYIRQASKGDVSPPNFSQDWKATAQEGQILGFLEGVAFWVRENRRTVEQRSKFLFQVEAERAERCLGHLDSEASRQWLPDVTEFRGAALAAALDLIKLHELVPDWHLEHRALAAWFNEQARRPSLQQTAPIP